MFLGEKKIKIPNKGSLFPSRRETRERHRAGSGQDWGGTLGASSESPPPCS